jgi:hypothetical protein
MFVGAVCFLQALRDDLASAGLAAKVIYSGGIDVDILAQVGWGGGGGWGGLGGSGGGGAWQDSCRWLDSHATRLMHTLVHVSVSYPLVSTCIAYAQHSHWRQDACKKPYPYHNTLQVSIGRYLHAATPGLGL